MLGNDVFEEGLFGDGDSEALEGKERRLREVPCICFLFAGEAEMDWYLV